MFDTISTKEFTFNKGTNTFVAEASSLPKDFNPMGKFYNYGKYITGFKLKSAKTGDIKNCIFTHTDGIEDVYGWNFKTSIGCNVLIIND